VPAKAEGADFIKLHNQVRADVYAAVADEVRRQRLTIQGHVPFYVTLAEALQRGQRSIEHLTGLYPAYSKDEQGALAEARRLSEQSSDFRGDFRAFLTAALSILNFDDQHCAAAVRAVIETGAFVEPDLNNTITFIEAGSEHQIRDSRRLYLPVQFRKMRGELRGTMIRGFEWCRRTSLASRNC
jgi:hypothetical protein